MKSTTLIFIVLVATASAFTIVNNDVPNTVNWPYAICATFDGWEAQNLTLTAAPARNMNDSVDFFAIANEYIEFDKVDVLVKFNGLFLHSQTVDFKAQFDSGDLIEYKYMAFVPSFAPSGNYVMSFTYKTPSGKQVGCWSFSFKI